MPDPDRGDVAAGGGFVSRIAADAENPARFRYRDGTAFDALAVPHNSPPFVLVCNDMNVTERCCAVQASCLGCYDHLRERRMAARGSSPQGGYSNKTQTLRTRTTEDQRSTLEKSK